MRFLQIAVSVETKARLHPNEKDRKLNLEESTPASRKDIIRVAIVGAGYIADFHANAIQQLDGVELVSVCDQNLSKAKGFTDRWSIPSAHDSLSSMLTNEKLDAIHVLVPPDWHCSVADLALRAGLHVFLEKPMCVSRHETAMLVELARANNRLLAVNHNMLFASAYTRLRKVVRSGDLGPLNHLTLNFFQEVGHIRGGPLDAWMLRSPRNLALEIGPHVFSAVLDLVGSPDEVVAIADRYFEVPGGSAVARRWRVLMTVQGTSIEVSINLGPTFTSRTISAYGLFGTAAADLDANTCVVDQNTTLGLDLDRLSRTRSAARQLVAQARDTFLDYALSKLKVRKRGNPYQTTIIDSTAAFYSSVRFKTKLDCRIDGASGAAVIELCDRVVDAAGVKPSAEPRGIQRTITLLGSSPTVLVLGAGGFIGLELVKQLLSAGYIVRAMVRGASPKLERISSDSLEIFRGNMLSEADLIAALKGIQFVYHLARADVKTWEDYLKFDVNPTEVIAKACQKMGVKRLIYTGTIDSYYAGKPKSIITEKTPLDHNIKRRNYYARAKAAGESILTEMHRKDGLPVVILRPGIVIGKGGTPFHWGVGMWGSGNLCQVWGDGHNKLPFVLVSDVASALVRSIQVPGIEGRCYNLIDVPMLSARDYIAELERFTGAKMRVFYRPIWRYYLADIVKWLVKIMVGHPEKSRIPSYFDWNSRTQRAQFDCAITRNEIGWLPASERDRLVKGIEASLESWLEATK
jgi:predicted dehydrogenase/nucleoside-diphosphate-sugar epimerase